MTVEINQKDSRQEPQMTSPSSDLLVQVLKGLFSVRRLYCKNMSPMSKKETCPQISIKVTKEWPRNRMIV